MAQTKVLHVSDTHLGKRHYGHGVRGDEFATAFERAIDVGVEHDVDAVVHTGDLFDDPQPALPTVTRCADVLDPPDERDVPFYAIVGDHDRSDDEQWADLYRRTDAVTRLGREPTVVGDAALYGIDAVRPGDWQTTDFSLEEPPAGVDSTILCMHELLDPPVDDGTADYPVEDVLDRVTIDLDGLALGGFHQPSSTRVDGTDVWYAGATERFGTDEAEPGIVQLLEIDDGTVSRRQLELETRSAAAQTITFDVDGVERVRAVLDRYDLTDAVASVELVVERGAVTADQVAERARDGAAAVDDGGLADDGPGRVDRAVEQMAGVPVQTAQNAIETAALRSFRRRSRRETAPAAQNAAEATPSDGTRRSSEEPPRTGEEPPRTGETTPRTGETTPRTDELQHDDEN